MVGVGHVVVCIEEWPVAGMYAAVHTPVHAHKGLREMLDTFLYYSLLYHSERQGLLLTLKLAA